LKNQHKINELRINLIKLDLTTAHHVAKIDFKGFSKKNFFNSINSSLNSLDFTILTARTISADISTSEIVLRARFSTNITQSLITSIAFWVAKAIDFFKTVKASPFTAKIFSFSAVEFGYTFIGSIKLRASVAIRYEYHVKVTSDLGLTSEFAFSMNFLTLGKSFISEEDEVFHVVIVKSVRSHTLTVAIWQDEIFRTGSIALGSVSTRNETWTASFPASIKAFIKSIRAL